MTPSFATFEDHNRKAFEKVLEEVDATPQNWERFTQQGAHFHKLYAKRWSNKSDGENLSHQIDPNFVMGL